MHGLIEQSSSDTMSLLVCYQFIIIVVYFQSIIRVRLIIIFMLRKKIYTGYDLSLVEATRIIKRQIN
jgi:hypothetical protein